jgi:hypothetical protein
MQYEAPKLVQAGEATALVMGVPTVTDGDNGVELTSIPGDYALGLDE